MKNKILKKSLIASAITLVYAFLHFYFALPALNLRSVELWTMLFTIAVVFILSFFFVDIKRTGSIKTVKPGKKYTQHIFVPKNMKIALSAVGGILAVLLVACFVSSSPVFRANEYQSMLKVNEASFSDDIAEMPLTQMPIVDKDTAQRLASRKIGEVVELVSQFNLSGYNSQINYQTKPYRVLPLEYAGIIKWMTNNSGGIPYYVTVDMATQNSELVELPEGMKYSPSEYFGRDLLRHVRFRYPTKMFDNITFEINDEGHPYWILSYYTYTIGIVGGKDISGIILCDAVTGELTDYKFSEIPQWIDTVFDASMIIEQADNWGSLKNGFMNSIFAQKNVVVTTEGYNYLAFNDDVWLYTGITSVVQDESNIGFILVNMRTKEARTYSINGAEEYSAMNSAEGAVQEKEYKATFPILINVDGVPTYFISLKDNAGLVKMYSFVAVSNYQIVGVKDTLEDAMNDYRRLLAANNIVETKPVPDNTETVTVKLDAVSSAVLDGNTVYYLKAGNRIYTAKISVSPSLPFLKAGDTVTFTASPADDGTYTVSKIG